MQNTKEAAIKSTAATPKHEHADVFKCNALTVIHSVSCSHTLSWEDVY